MYYLICLIGPSGCGKDTVLKETLKQCQAQGLPINKIINCTTRPKRENEINNQDYHFITIDEFTKKMLSNELIEATNFNDWFYGTERKALRDDQVNIGIFNPEAIDAILEDSKKNNFDCKIYYIKVSDKERLIRQLKREKEPNVSEIIRRYSTDEIDYDTRFFTWEFETLLNETLKDKETSVNKILENIKNFSVKEK